MTSKSKKVKAITVKEPEVNNTINMNLTHADVIDVAIQTQLEILEPQLENLEKCFKDCKKQLEDLQTQVMTKALERAGSAPVGKMFLSIVKTIAKELNITLPEYQISSKYFNGDQETLSSKEVDIDECNSPEEYKMPLAQFKRYAKKGKMNWTLSDRISFTLSVYIQGIEVTTRHQECKIQLTETEMKNWKKMVQSILDVQADLCQQCFDTHKQILELKYDEKKVKARVVKMSLSKTEQGRNILTLLESATNTKLLQ